CFFFSSRRRHTRLQGDWSSDVCSSDLPPDLVLLDVMMPGIDGFETCRRLRQLPNLQKTPVIFMTALSDAQDKVRAFAAGADDYRSEERRVGKEGRTRCAA